MKMLKAKLCYLPLGFSISHKPNSFYYCNTINYSISLSIYIDLIIILFYDHTYYKVYYDNNRFNCSYYLSFL